MTQGKHKYHLVNWESVSMHKDFGGLGVQNLRDLNICLLGSWIKRYQADKGRLWREVIDYKYKTDNQIFSALEITIALSFLEVSCGLPKQLKWVSDGRWEMGRK
jgi:hypothetical protein